MATKTRTLSSDVEDDDEGGMFCGLFVDEDYLEEKFEFIDNNSNRLCLSALCSKASSTDFDLTGQVVWPVSIFLGWFVARNPDIFRGKTVVELGAGCGLPGLVAAKLGAKAAVLTDGSEIVMRLLERQKAFFEKHTVSIPRVGEIIVNQLEWGKKTPLDNMLSRISSEQPKPSVIIGADVICWPQCIIPLLETIKFIFLSLEDPFQGEFYVGYVCRATNIGDQFFACAEAMGFISKKVDPASFLPINANERVPENQANDDLIISDKLGWPSNVLSQYDLELLCVSLDRESKVAIIPPQFTPSAEGTVQDFPF